MIHRSDSFRPPFGGACFSLPAKRRFASRMFAAALPLLATQLSATEIILMDYDDGDAGNGVHDANINNGDIGVQDWIGDLQYSTSNVSGVGSNQNLIMGSNRTASHTMETTGYSADVGHTLTPSFMWRTAANWDADDRPVFSIFYTDDDTITGSPTDLFSYEVPTAGTGTYRVEDVPSHVIVDPGATGKTLFVRLADNASAIGGEFYRADNIFVSVEDTPVSPILAVDSSFSFTDTNGGGSFSIPVSHPAGAGATTDLTISGVTPTGADAGDVAVTTSFNLVVAPNGSSQIDFTFTPSSGVGTYTFDLEIASDDVSQTSPRVVPVQIEVQPNPALTAPDTFTDVNDGTSMNYVIPISNDAANSTTALSITDVQATGTDAPDVSNIGFPGSLAAGASGSITFDFAPTQGGGTYTFDIVITSTDQSQASPRTIPVTITVQDPVISVASASLDFGTFASAPGPQVLTLSVTNTGGATDLTIDAFGSYIDGATEFAVTSYPGPIAPGASADIEITFTPGAAEGLFTGTLHILSDDFAGTEPQIALKALVFPAGNNVAAVDFGSAASPVAPDYTQFIAAEGASQTIGGVGIQITSAQADISAGTGAQADPLYADQARTTFNGAVGNYISVILSGFDTGTLNLVSFHDYNYGAGVPLNLVFGEVGGTLDPVASNISRPSSASYTAAVESGKTYELRITENGNANLAYISGLLLWGDSVPGGTPFGNFVSAAGLDPETTGLPGLDPDFDGVATGVEWVVGGSANDPANPDTGKLPTGTTVNTDPDNDTVSSDYLLFSYRLSDAAAADAGTAVSVEYGGDLSGWTTATDGVDGVVILTTADGYETGVARVDVYIPVGATELFARLKVEL
ncbi:MAG: choice-of-anchor D domain-containing protein [Verrucomicrobiae bacterium]|nr:choice-of-anchor D domain-containing protein [Verrucomicrobiae bacterium]